MCVVYQPNLTISIHKFSTIYSIIIHLVLRFTLYLDPVTSITLTCYRLPSHCSNCFNFHRANSFITIATCFCPRSSLSACLSLVHGSAWRSLSNKHRKPIHRTNHLHKLCVVPTKLTTQTYQFQPSRVIDYASKLNKRSMKRVSLIVGETFEVVWC